MNLDEALSNIIRSSAVTCKLAANVSNYSTLQLEETVLTFNKISPKLEESEKSNKVGRKFRKIKKVMLLN